MCIFKYFANCFGIKSHKSHPNDSKSYSSSSSAHRERIQDADDDAFASKNGALQFDRIMVENNLDICAIFEQKVASHHAEDAVVLASVSSLPTAASVSSDVLTCNVTKTNSAKQRPTITIGQSEKTPPTKLILPIPSRCSRHQLRFWGARGVPLRGPNSL